MSDLRELYQELIIDHGRCPRNFGKLDPANYSKEGYNPLCGDKVTVYLQEENGLIKDIRFEGCGCAISMASASLMTEMLKGKTIEQVKNLFDQFHRLVTGEQTKDQANQLGKLVVLSGVSEYPARVKCATLSWHTVIAALTNSPENITTE